jgi:hypothetical protein
MNVMLTKIATNLKVYGSSEEVVEATLALFQASMALSILVLQVAATTFVKL